MRLRDYRSEYNSSTHRCGRYYLRLRSRCLESIIHPCSMKVLCHRCNSCVSICKVLRRGSGTMVGCSSGPSGYYLQLFHRIPSFTHRTSISSFLFEPSWCSRPYSCPSSQSYVLTNMMPFVTTSQGISVQGRPQVAGQPDIGDKAIGVFARRGDHNLLYH